jgi:hypothetical protein
MATMKRPKRKVPIRVVIKQILNPNGSSYFPQADNAVPFTSAQANPVADATTAAPKKKKKKKAAGPNVLLIGGLVLGGLVLVFMFKKKRGLAGYVEDVQNKGRGFLKTVQGK